MADLSGRDLGGCRLIRPIGAGGMGEVYLGEQMRLGNRPVAVKVIRLDDSALSPDALQEVERRFKEEASLLAKFSHPNILAVYDAGVEDGVLYLVMEYVPGGSLADAIRKGPSQRFPLPMAPDLAINLVGQVAAALQYTHDRGVVHRDVKPGNILLRAVDNDAWQALLADFGVARAMQAQTQHTQVTGTLAYMSPEQFSGTFSPASDQYALGIVTYLLLAGRPPFEGDIATVSQAHLNQPPPSIRTFNPAISPAVNAVVLRALAKQPSDRYPSVAAFAQALRAAEHAPAGAVEEVASVTKPGKQPESRQESGPAPWVLPGDQPARGPRQPGLGRAWLAVAAVVVLLVGVLGGAGLLRQRQQQIVAQQTQTAIAQGTTSIYGTQTAQAKETANTQAGATQTAVAAVETATAAANIPTATATADISTDVTSPPPAPSQAFKIVFADAAPTCHGDTPTWVVDNSTHVVSPCPANGVEIVAQSQSTLGCIEQKSSSIPKDAYISVLVTPKSGVPVLGFRVGAVSGGSGSTQLAGTGYFYQVDPQNADYLLYSFDTASHTIVSGSLPGTPAADFALGVLVQGKRITLYVNGQPLSTPNPILDSTYASGWISLCTTGDTIFRDVQVYNLKSSVQ